MCHGRVLFWGFNCALSVWLQNDETDFNAVKRAGNIEKFINDNIGKPNIEYGMIIFADDTSPNFSNSSLNESSEVS